MREMVSPEHPRLKGQRPQCSYIPPYGDRVDGPFKSLSDPDGNSQRTSISHEDSCRDITSSFRCYSSNELVMAVSMIVRQGAFATFPSGLLIYRYMYNCS